MHLFVIGILSQDDYLWTFQLEQAASPKTPLPAAPGGSLILGVDSFLLPLKASQT